MERKPVNPLSVLGPVRRQASAPQETVAKNCVVDLAVYVAGERVAGEFTFATALSAAREQGGFAWVGLHEPDQAHMHEVGSLYGLHDLAVEDALTSHQRPKLDRYDDTLVLVLRTVKYVDHEIGTVNEIVDSGQIMIFAGTDFVVTVRHGDFSGLSGVRAKLEKTPQHLALGPTAVLHAVADHVVDDYLRVTGFIEEDVDTMEDGVFTPGRRVRVEAIYQLKREVVELRRAIVPLGPAFQLLLQNTDLIGKEVRRYFRDVVDHHSSAADQVSSFDESLSALIGAAMATVAMQQNLDMRKISAWVAIASVPTMVAGIYGMNFVHMPELQWTYSYPVVLTFLATACITLFVVFRRNDWL